MVAFCRSKWFDFSFGFGDYKTERQLNKGFDFFQRNRRARTQKPIISDFHKSGGQKLKEIGMHFGIGVSGVSPASRRVAVQIKDDKKLKKKIDKIISDLNLSTV